jgi:phosphatidylglycerophosphate synthase
MSDDREARERWSTAHGGIDPDASAWVSGWLSIVHRLTRPLAGRGIPPARVTLAGVLVAALVPLLAWRGDGWPLLATVCVVASGLLDGVDGALARWDGSTTPWGGVLDELADRCSDLMLLAALGLLGAPWWLCVLAAVLTLLLESVRSSARVAGLEGVGVVTVWERPARLVAAAFGTGLCGLAWLAADLLPWADAPERIAGAVAAIAVALAVVGLVHLLLRVHRALSARAPLRPDRPAR